MDMLDTHWSTQGVQPTINSVLSLEASSTHMCLCSQHGPGLARLTAISVSRVRYFDQTAELHRVSSVFRRMQTTSSTRLPVIVCPPNPTRASSPWLAVHVEYPQGLADDLRPREHLERVSKVACWGCRAIFSSKTRPLLPGCQGLHIYPGPRP